jgi:succinate dehydrogenase/fumarate reductase cytochrome b subunit
VRHGGPNIVELLPAAMGGVKQPTDSRMIVAFLLLFFFCALFHLTFGVRRH